MIKTHFPPIVSPTKSRTDGTGFWSAGAFARWLKTAGRMSALAACITMSSAPGTSRAEESPVPVTAQTASASPFAASQAEEITHLIQLLRDDRPAVRKGAVEKLTWHAKAALPALPDLLDVLNDQDPALRAAAARAVWAIDRRADEAVPVLVELLGSDDAEHKELAAYFLGPMGKSAHAAVPALKRAMTDRDPLVQVHAAEALVQIDPQAQDALDTLFTALQNPAAEVRTLAAMSLGQVPPAQAHRVVPALTACLADRDSGVRASAELSLASFDQTVARSDQANPFAEPDSPPFAAEPAPESLAPTARNTTPFASPGVAAGSSSVERLSELDQAVRDLSVADQTIRKNALERIAWLGPQARPAVYELKKCLHDHNAEIRAYAAKALWDVDPQSAALAISTLQVLVDSTQPGLRPLAAFFLGYIGPQAADALPTLKRAMANSTAMDQLQLAEAIARINPRDQAAVGVLIEALRNPNSEVRFSAAYALSEVSPAHAEQIIPELAAAMGDQNPTVRQAAEFALTVFQPELVPAPAAPYEEPRAAEGIALLEPIAEEPGFANAQPESLPEEPFFEETAPIEQLGLGKDYRPINSLDVNISLKRRAEDGQPLSLPTNYGAAWLRKIPPKLQPTGESRPWTVQAVQYSASGFYHRPLYFEEINLERYGNHFGHCVQPFVSAVAFYGRVPLLPYMMVAEPPHECQYTLGHYRPGTCVPYQCTRLPWSTKGALVEAGLITGLVFLIY